MAKRVYNDGDKAAVWTALQVNKGNVAATHRDTGVPEQTIRDWKKQWDEVPPEFDEQVITAEIQGFLQKAESVRDMLLEKYSAALAANKVSPDKMPVHIGIFIDKVQLLRGLATSRTENTVALPSAEELKQLFRGMVQGALEAQNERDEDIIDVELEEQAEPKALPRTTD